MTIKVAINGFGRIGRNILRAHYESNKSHDLQIVAINDLGPAETNAHLTRYDTAHGKFPGKVEVDGDHIVVNGDRIKVVAQRDPAQHAHHLGRERAPRASRAAADGARCADVDHRARLPRAGARPDHFGRSLLRVCEG